MGGNISITRPVYSLGGIKVSVHGDVSRVLSSSAPTPMMLRFRCTLSNRTPSDSCEREADAFLRGESFRRDTVHLFYHEAGERLASESRLGISDVISDRVSWQIQPGSVVKVTTSGTQGWAREVQLIMDCRIEEGGAEVKMYQVAALMAASLAWTMRDGSLPSAQGSSFDVRVNRVDFWMMGVIRKAYSRDH